MLHLRRLIRLLVVVSLIATPLLGGAAAACTAKGEPSAKVCDCANCGEEDSPASGCPHIAYPLPRACDAAVLAAGPAVAVEPTLAAFGQSESRRIAARADAPDPPPPR